MRSPANPKLSQYVLAALLDGREKNLGDLLPFLTGRISPNVAVRCYQRDHTRKRKENKIGREVPALRKDNPLAEQIRLGRRRAALATVQGLGRPTHSRPQPLITIRREGEHAETFMISLSPAGVEYIRRRTSDRTYGPVWRALVKAYSEGWMSIDVTVRKEPPERLLETPPTPEQTAGEVSTIKEGESNGQVG